MGHDGFIAALGRMLAIVEEAPARFRALAEAIRKSKRGKLGLAKRGARAVRHDLVLVAGYDQPIPEEWVRDMTARYIASCAILGVTPPVVHVPRSLQSRLGKTIGGKVKRDGWDASPLSDGILEYAAARGEP
jgi:hypothetical protein